jgi:3-methyladenine DNA glycosylase AlkD
VSAQDFATRYRAEIAALPKRDTPHLRALRKGWSAALKGEDALQVVAIAEALEAVSPQERQWMAYELIRHHKAAFAAVSLTVVDCFAERAASWYAVDALGTILTGPLSAAGRLPDDVVEGWSRSDNRWRRRLSLTTDVGRTATRPDPARTFALCLRLADDRDDMVEKAVSWALRYLSQKDRAAVDAFMAEHGERFRPRVKREVGHKLRTGLKSGRVKAEAFLKVIAARAG